MLVTVSIPVTLACAIIIHSLDYYKHFLISLLALQTIFQANV